MKRDITRDSKRTILCRVNFMANFEEEMFSC